MSAPATVNPLFPFVDRFDGALTPVASPEAVGGGYSGATVLKVVGREEVFALRGWPEDADPRRVRALHRLLGHVAGRGVPVAVPRADGRGETLFRHDGRWWQVEPWLPGRADYRTSPSEAKLASAMTTLAAFHQAAATFMPSPDDAEWFGGPPTGPAPAVRDRLSILRRYAGGEVDAIRQSVGASGPGEFAEAARRTLRAFDRLAPQVEAELRFSTAIEVPLLPCLRDVWHDHVLYTRDAVTGLIDPSACRRDTAAADLSRLLGSLLGDDAPRWDAAIAAYHRRRPLTDGESALIPVLDRSSVLLSAMTWLRRRYLLGRPCDTPAVTSRLREAVTRLERMMAG